MRVKTTSGIFLAVISLILFFAGTGLCLLNHWDKSQPFLSVENIMAITRAAFLTTAEFVFFVGDFRLMNAKKTIKKITCAVVLTILAACMTWVIGSEWEASAQKDSARAGLSATAQIQENAVAASKSKRERVSATTAALSNAKEITEKMLGASTRAYQVSFLFALVGFVILHFCIEVPKRRTIGAGNILPTSPELQERVKTLGFDQKTVRAYRVPGGIALHTNRGYEAFLKDEPKT